MVCPSAPTATVLPAALRFHENIDGAGVGFGVSSRGPVSHDNGIAVERDSDPEGVVGLTI